MNTQRFHLFVFILSLFFFIFFGFVVSNMSKAGLVEAANLDKPSGYPVSTTAYMPLLLNAEENSELFPTSLTIASPLDVSATANKGGSASFIPTYMKLADEIKSVLSGATAVTAVFDPSQLLIQSVNAPCYGPALDYTDHPGAVTPNSGQLPTGDLGIWLEVDTATGHACSAAQVNSRMADNQNQATGSLMLLASMISVANSNGISLPTGGGTINLTTEMNAASIPYLSFNNATISFDSSTNEWGYEADFDFTHPISSTTHHIVIVLNHSPGSISGYSGDMSYRVNYYQNGGNCGGGLNQVTINGSLAYDRTSSSDVKVQSRIGTFCGHNTNGLVDNIVDPTASWADNFSIFTANFDANNLSGNYAYAWQAGNMDSHTRVLNIGINDHEPLDGEAYFGYGDRVQDDADGSIGIEGLFCNWAGPGNKSIQPYAQRQFVRFNSSTGLFEQPVGGSDILYAPTEDCSYDGTGTFWYDRNLDSVANEGSADLEVNPPDLLEAFDGSDADSVPTVEEAIANRGYTLPTAP